MYYVISRVADAEYRAQLELDDNWDQKVGFDNVKQAEAEFTWLKAHSNFREFKLIKVEDKPLLADDIIPWP